MVLIIYDLFFQVLASFAQPIHLLLTSFCQSFRTSTNMEVAIPMIHLTVINDLSFM